MVKVTRQLLPTEHENQKWLVLRGEIEGCPQVTKTRTIDTASLAAGRITLDAEKQKLVDDVNEYYMRWQAVQTAMDEMEVK